MEDEDEIEDKYAEYQVELQKIAEDPQSKKEDKVVEIKDEDAEESEVMLRRRVD